MRLCASLGNQTKAASHSGVRASAPPLGSSAFGHFMLRAMRGTDRVQYETLRRARFRSP